jgi:hypothetical protein
MPGGILDSRDPFPKKSPRFQFPQPIECIANFPQGIESLSGGGELFELSLYNVQLTVERFTFFPDLLDLRVQRRQFLFQ